jgi:probable F420-dependent oxidoreductase
VIRAGFTWGTNYAGVPAPETFFRLVDRVEELGLDSLWIGDHITWSNPLLESVTAVACYAARTRRITIGTGVIITPLRQPVVLAKQLSTLAYLSGGRVVAGLGVGGENPNEFQASGVSLRDRGRMTDEAIEIMRRLWTEDHVTFHGRHFTFDDVTLDPKPARLPIYIGGRSEAAYRRAARWADGFIAVFSSHRHFAEAKAAIEGFGCRPAMDWAQFEFMHIGPDRDASRAKVLDYMNRTYGMDFGERVERFASFGRPEDIAERLARFQQLGMTHLIVNAACTPAETPGQLELFAAEVLPLLR